MPLPHIQNSEAGRNKYDYVDPSLFEVYFTLPSALQAEFLKDSAVLTEHVTKVDGLKTLDPTVDTVTQTFMGTTRTFFKSKLQSTSHEIGVTLTLNLRNTTDNYIYKLFKAWNMLGYNLSTGEIVNKKDYVADYLMISIANRAGDVYRQVVFKDVMMTMESAFDTLDYTSGDPVELQVKFYSDWASETNV